MDTVLCACGCGKATTIPQRNSTRDEPSGKGWHVDHCHKTGRVRGILCTKCNCLLGMSGDSVETLLSAIRYLTANSEPTVSSEKDLVN